VGTRQWSREAGQRTWTAGRNGGAEAQFSTRTYLNWWTPYTAHPRLLDIVTTGSAQQAEIASASEGAGLGTVWLQLLIDIEHHRVLRIRMITAAHFMTQTWRGFNARTRVQAPASSLDAGRRYAQLG